MQSHDLRLSVREEEILQLIGTGLSNKQVARHLGISQSTVSTHLERLYKRNGLHTRAEAVALRTSLQRHAEVASAPAVRLPQGLVGWLLFTPLVVAGGVIAYMVSPTYLWGSLGHLGPVAGGLCAVMLVAGLTWQGLRLIRRRRTDRQNAVTGHGAGEPEHALPTSQPARAGSNGSRH